MSKSKLDLETLAPNCGARRLRHRVGRGNGSGSGLTSGKGHKGQKARAGCKSKPHFEGGQMPLYRRLPKLGFSSMKKISGVNRFRTVSLSVLDRFENGTVVDADALSAIGYGVDSKCKGGIKILASGTLSKKLTVKVHAISAAAKSKIEAAGGAVELAK